MRTVDFVPLTTDNRDLNEMVLYYEDRIEALKKRIQELETENARLTQYLHSIAVALHSNVPAEEHGN